MGNSIRHNDKVFWFEWVLLFLSIVVIVAVLCHVEELKGKKQDTTEAPRKQVIQTQPASFSRAGDSNKKD